MNSKLNDMHRWRSNHQKYTYLQPDLLFSDLSDEQVHEGLKQGLLQNNFNYLTKLQKSAIDKEVLAGKSMLIRGENGCGKTLTYLLPILDQLHRYKSETEGGISLKIRKENEDFMFQNAT